MGTSSVLAIAVPNLHCNVVIAVCSSSNTTKSSSVGRRAFLGGAGLIAIGGPAAIAVAEKIPLPEVGLRDGRLRGCDGRPPCVSTSAFQSPSRFMPPWTVSPPPRTCCSPNASVQVGDFCDSFCVCVCVAVSRLARRRLHRPQASLAANGELRDQSILMSMGNSIKMTTYQNCHSCYKVPFRWNLWLRFQTCQYRAPIASIQNHYPYDNTLFFFY